MALLCYYDLWRLPCTFNTQLLVVTVALYNEDKINLCVPAAPSWHLSYREPPLILKVIAFNTTYCLGGLTAHHQQHLREQ